MYVCVCVLYKRGQLWRVWYAGLVTLLHIHDACVPRAVLLRDQIIELQMEETGVGWKGGWLPALPFSSRPTN